MLRSLKDPEPVGRELGVVSTGVELNLHSAMPTRSRIPSITTGKKIFTECQVFCRVFFSGTRQRVPLPSVFLEH
jgi:hypothetical protein